ncbi:MAG: hypothetical protein QNK36_00300 [Colwellia sp.]|nr:hypothetical protein [Colwellia sp.]
MKNLSKTLAAITVIISMTSNVNAKTNSLFTLENLERQRAALLENLTTKQVSFYQREQETKHLIKRLVDLERMVLRDDRIAASNSIMAKKAFQSYELTFLVHAGSESKKSPMAHWLYSLKITDESIANSSAGAR